jgi:hypothetical protein
VSLANSAIESQHPLSQEGQQIVNHVRFFLLDDEVARFVFGKAGVHQGQDPGMLSFGIELLQLRCQAGALGCGVMEEMQSDDSSVFVFF